MVRHFLAVMLCGFAAQASLAADTECYDLKVEAKAITQIPSVYPQSDDPNVIVMSWPWFLDLKVKRVIDGDFSGETIEALDVMHVAYIRKNLIWFFRKNAAGTFNVVQSNTPNSLARCPAGMKPARPPIIPAEGQSYADLRIEGEAAYGRLREGNLE